MKILFAGDALISNREFTLSDEIKNVFDRCDILICNFEAPCADPEQDKPIIKAGPAIYQAVSSIKSLKKAGFNYVSIANNHIVDYGKNALVRTIEELKKHDIVPMGAGTSFAEAYKPHIVERDNKTVAFISLSQAEFGVYKYETDSLGYAWINHPSVNDLILRTKEQADLVYIIAHAGLETVPYPLPEWRDKYKEMIDAGADCIIGGHPHIVQGYELYKGKYIFYSLGNFFFDYSSSQPESADKGLMVICDTENMSEPEIISFRISDKGLVSVDKSEQTKEELAYRSEILSDEKAYMDKINEIVEDFWEKYYASYYNCYNPMFMITTMPVKSILKHIVERVLRRNTDNPVFIDKTMLLHNIQIETHRWVVERYLYNVNKKQNNF